MGESKKGESKVEKWSNKCAAYKKLYQQFRDGTFNPLKYTPKAIHESDSIYMQYDLNRFRSNIARVAAGAIEGMLKYSFIFHIIKI